MDGLRVTGKAESIATRRGAKVNGHHHGEGGLLGGSGLGLLQVQDLELASSQQGHPHPPNPQRFLCMGKTLPSTDCGPDQPWTWLTPSAHLLRLLCPPRLQAEPWTRLSGSPRQGSSQAPAFLLPATAHPPPDCLSPTPTSHHLQRQPLVWAQLGAILLLQAVLQHMDQCMYFTLLLLVATVTQTRLILWQTEESTCMSPEKCVPSPVPGLDSLRIRGSLSGISRARSSRWDDPGSLGVGR